MNNKLGKPRQKYSLWIISALGPVLLLFAVIRVYPIINTIRLSFFKYHITNKVTPFVGLDNYRKMLTDSAFHVAFINTIQFTILAVVITLTLALIMAILLRSIEKASTVYEIIFYIPVVIPWVPASIIWKWIYDPMYGILNYIFTFLGLPKIQWLTSPDIVLYAIVIVSIWKMMGYFMIVYSVGLKNIPIIHIEAAEIDGATPWQRIKYIILPAMKPIILFTVVMSSILFFNVFSPVYVLTASAQGAPAYDLKVVVSEVYRNAFQFYRMGYAGALSVVLLVFVMIMILLQFILLKEED